MNEESCATCRFWKRDSAGGAVRGLCRPHPPRLLVPVPNAVEEPWRQPHTLESEWCGEYELDLRGQRV